MLTSSDPPRDRARALVLRHGWNTTAYQILNPGFEHWYPAATDGVVGLVRRSRAWVVGGAPVCAPERLAPIAAELEEAAGKAGARVCYVGAQGRLAERCLPDPRFAGAVLGAEPWWDPNGWPAVLATRASLRAQLGRARNKGVAVRKLEAPEDERASLERLLGEWLSGRGLPPLGFLTTPWLLDQLGDRAVFLAERGGTAVGFAVLTPIPGREGWLVELLVRGAGAPNGCAELMVNEAFGWVARTGGRFVTLGLSPLAGPDVASVRPAPWWLRGGMRWLRAHGSRFYDFTGLHAFKAKLSPDGWMPVYAIANEPRLSLRTMRGVGEAMVGGGLLGFGIRALRWAVVQEFRWVVGGR